MPKTQRILSIDAFRGITIFVMVFVNDLAGTPGVPAWMGHMPADANAMSFVDVVFPAFLFIAGMSIPFALSNRLEKGDSFLQLQLHILWRVLGLLTLGFFMVNGEEGYNEKAAMLPLHAWLLLFYFAAILTWNVYTFKNRYWGYLLRALGIILLVALAFLYRGGDGKTGMRPQWWGILGLIGWAYLYACILYQLLKGNLFLLLLAIAACTAFNLFSRMPYLQNSDAWSWTAGQTGNAAHTSIVLCGVLLSQIFFRQRLGQGIKPRVLMAIGFTVLLFLAAYLIRPWFGVSKIYATPAWCLYSAAWSCIVFGLMYWLIDINGSKKWVSFFRPAAVNPLLTYILPGILFSFFSLTHLGLFPQRYRHGMYGILWSLLFSVVVMYMAKGLTRLRIRMQL